MRTTHRRVAALVAPVLVLSGLAAGQSASAAPDPTPSGSAAATWIAGELTGGLFHFVIDQDPDPDLEYDDYGLSVDAGLAELALGNPSAAAEVRDAVATHINDYIAGDAFGDTGSTYAGPTGKALVFAQHSGGDPTSFGGVNLVTRLESVVLGTAGLEGRLKDTTLFTDYANTIGQSFAAAGLTAAGSSKAAAVTSYLLKQQCPAGFFRLNFADPAAPDQSCTTNTAPDTDVTVFAVLNLQSQSSNPAVKAALDKAIAWLIGTQAADGSFGGGGVTAAANTNSTGLAAAALGQACAVPQADRAAAYVRTFQVPAGQTGPLASEVGAIAYDAGAMAAGQTNGITPATSDQWRRATSQAAPGLVWDDKAAATLTLQGPVKYVRGGTDITLSVNGPSAGERFCVVGGGTRSVLTGTGQTISAKVTLPDRTGETAYSASTGPGVATVVVKVLAAKKLRPHAAKVVHRGDRQLVRIKGLAKKEKVKIYVDGKLVDKAVASRKGIVVSRFRAQAPPGTHHTVKVVGQFDDRKGKTTYRVVG